MSHKPLILLHGWSMNPAVFGDLRRRLLSDCAVLAPALPGYPGSDWQSLAEFGREIDAMAGDLPAGRLVGWSLGGLYAIELAHRFPERFDAVALIASNPCFVRRQDWSCGLDVSAFDGFYADLERDWRRALRRFLALQTLGGRDQRDDIRALADTIEAAGTPAGEVLRRGLDRLRDLDCRETLASLSQPRLLVLGEYDRLVPPELAREITDLAPEVRVESVAGAAHAPFLSHPEQVADLLATWPK